MGLVLILPTVWLAVSDALWLHSTTKALWLPDKAECDDTGMCANNVTHSSLGMTPSVVYLPSWERWEDLSTGQCKIRTRSAESDRVQDRSYSSDNGLDIGAGKKKTLAFLFVIRDHLPWAPVWKRFFNDALDVVKHHNSASMQQTSEHSHEHLLWDFEIFIHRAEDTANETAQAQNEILEIKLGELYTSRLRQKIHLVDTVWTEWANMWGAQLALVKSVMKFEETHSDVYMGGGVLLSDSCVPVQSFIQVWEALMRQQNSKKTSQDSKHHVPLNRDLSILHFSNPRFSKAIMWGFWARDLLEKLAYRTELCEYPSKICPQVCDHCLDKAKAVRFLHDDGKPASDIANAEQPLKWSEWHQLPFEVNNEVGTPLVIQHFGIPVRHGYVTFDCSSLSRLKEQEYDQSTMASSIKAEISELNRAIQSLEKVLPLQFAHHLPLSFLKELRTHSEAVFMRKVMRKTSGPLAGSDAVRSDPLDRAIMENLEAAISDGRALAEGHS